MAATEQQLAWLKSMVPAAQEAELQYGVPASVTLAQCILESGWGQSGLAREANNFFGIKAEHLDQPDTYREFLTAEYVHGSREMLEAEFEFYPDAAASFVDHARLLATAPRYAPAMAAKGDPVKFAQQLQLCGYSTSPVYATELQQLMVEHSLAQYDGNDGGQLA